jgi:hypothetical protein
MEKAKQSIVEPLRGDLKGGGGEGGVAQGLGGSALQSLVGFSTVAGGLAMVGNAIGGFVSGLFTHAARASEAARLLQEAQVQFGRSMAAFRAEVLGSAADLDTAIRRVREEAAALRAEARAAHGR